MLTRQKSAIQLFSYKKSDSFAFRCLYGVGGTLDKEINMRIRTLKQKILLSVSLALALAVLLMSAATWYQTRQQLLDDGFHQLQNLATAGGRAIDGWLGSKKQVVDALAGRPSIDTQHELQLVKQAGGFLAAYRAAPMAA